MSADPCPACGDERSSVTDSRPVNGAIRRRRSCRACGERYTTYETLQAPSVDRRSHPLLGVDDLRRMQASLRRLLRMVDVSLLDAGAMIEADDNSPNARTSTHGKNAMIGTRA